MHTGNTSPGSDNITVNLLRAVWHVIGTHVRRLFERCLNIGHHPRPFKEAEIAMVTKPGRRDLTSPRAWRPVSLSSCLSSCPQQAEALHKGSATDLVAALIHDIEEAFARNKVVTLVTMDIQCAFDTALVLRVRQQAWPDHVARWAGLFMDGRSARVKYQDNVSW
ncbi:uncharacterized protein FMAN_16253 [Fusarium mangiferae]|uniref:Reverse transcriptase domain-containing protein n=1 Tax=Fusarium mangiferae TaxID=192010 RepID=A0A1L7UBQ8_FUSMA|nr:uncharacterized protein FMAN_16253 [Fusarium mangiferae]CVL08158.1 uncharacterized protein FMAN_16253 [Fusarium mangiferae]